MNYTKIKKNIENEISINLDFLKSIYRIQSPSRKEGQMINFIQKYVSNLKDVTCKKDYLGNLLITKGILEDDEYYPCLIAHMDEVHSFNSNRKIIQVDDFIFAWDSKRGQRDGLGADDKNGIYIALELLQKFDKIKIFFSVGEEIGLIGTNGVNLAFFNDIGYMLQCDRRGNNDLIIFTNGIHVTSDEFLYDIDEIRELYGYKEQYGVLTDVGGLKHRGVNVSGCNISCGYWDEHTDEELTHIPSLENCMNFVYNIIDSLGTSLYKHDYLEEVNTYSYNNYYSTNYEDDPCYGCVGSCHQCKYY